MSSLNQISDGIRLAKQIRDLVQEYPPQLAMVAINTMMDLIIEECAVNKRELCLRLSRHYLNLSKEYKDEGKEIEGSDRKQEPLCEDKIERPRAKTAKGKVRKK